MYIIYIYMYVCTFLVEGILNLSFTSPGREGFHIPHDDHPKVRTANRRWTMALHVRTLRRRGRGDQKMDIFSTMICILWNSDVSSSSIINHPFSHHPSSIHPEEVALHQNFFRGNKRRFRGHRFSSALGWVFTDLGGSLWRGLDISSRSQQISWK